MCANWVGILSQSWSFAPAVAPLRKLSRFCNGSLNHSILEQPIFLANLSRRVDTRANRIPISILVQTNTSKISGWGMHRHTQYLWGTLLYYQKEMSEIHKKMLKWKFNSVSSWLLKLFTSASSLVIEQIVILLRSTWAK